MEHLDLLIELLRKISKSKDHVHIEINYDGKEFTWKVTQRNVTASEWTPGELRKVDSDKKIS